MQSSFQRKGSCIISRKNQIGWVSPAGGQADRKSVQKQNKADKILVVTPSQKQLASL